MMPTADRPGWRCACPARTCGTKSREPVLLYTPQTSRKALEARRGRGLRLAVCRDAPTPFARPLAPSRLYLCMSSANRVIRVLSPQQFDRTALFFAHVNKNVRQRDVMQAQILWGYWQKPNLAWVCGGASPHEPIGDSDQKA